MDNPFLATGHELITLDTRDVMDDAVAVSLSKIHEIGQALHKTLRHNQEKQHVHIRQPS